MNPMYQISMRSFLLITGLCLSIAMSGQAVIKFEAARSSVNSRAFSEYFSDYAVGSIDPMQVVTLLRSRQQFDTLKLVADDVEYAFSLEARDIRTDDFVLMVDGKNINVSFVTIGNKKSFFLNCNFLVKYQ